MTIKDFFKGFFSIFTKPFKSQKNPSLLKELQKAADNYKGEMFFVINNDEIKKLFQAQTNFRTHFFRDTKYCLLSEEVIIDFSVIYTRFIGSKFRHKNEVFDCDNSAEIYKALFSLFAAMIPNMKHSFAIGRIVGKLHWVKSMHEVNVFINESKEVRFIEPQICMIKDPKESDKIVHIDM